ncbi:MAG: outer membrane beta-barrel protein [Pseudomonadota bacterium]
MRSISLISFLAGLGLAGSALAGGLDTPAPAPTIVPAPVTSTTPDWTGFYAGGQIGYGDVSTGDAANVDGDGEFFGVHAGYNWDFGTTVIGAEIDYDEANIDLDGGAGSVDDVLRLRLRAGYDFGNGFLGYGAIGAARAGAEIGGTDFDDTGWLAGVGVAYDFGNNFVLGGDVTYHEFNNFDDTNIDVEVTTISARLSYRF